MRDRSLVLDDIVAGGVVAVLRASTAERAIVAGEALIVAGVRSIEEMKPTIDAVRNNLPDTYKVTDRAPIIGAALAGNVDVEDIDPLMTSVRNALSDSYKVPDRVPVLAGALNNNPRWRTPAVIKYADPAAATTE